MIINTYILPLIPIFHQADREKRESFVQLILTGVNFFVVLNMSGYWWVNYPKFKKGRYSKKGSRQ